MRWLISHQRYLRLRCASTSKNKNNCNTQKKPPNPDYSRLRGLPYPSQGCLVFYQVEAFFQEGIDAGLIEVHIGFLGHIQAEQFYKIRRVLANHMELRSAGLMVGNLLVGVVGFEPSSGCLADGFS
nr:MAG TPA: hypothetical protein [Caudoviricetes sp.]